VVGYHTSGWQPPLAVDTLRRRRRIFDLNSAKEPREGALLALAGSLGKISHSLFIADRHGEPSAVGPRFGRNTNGILLCDGGGQPAFHRASDAGASSGRSPRLRSYAEPAPPASDNSYRGVALRIRPRTFCVVDAMAANLAGHSGGLATARRSRSGSAASTGAYGRDTQADPNVFVTSFFGTRDFRHQSPDFGMA